MNWSVTIGRQKGFILTQLIHVTSDPNVVPHNKINQGDYLDMKEGDTKNSNTAYLSNNIDPFAPSTP